MTWTWTLPISCTERAVIRPPLIDARELRAVVPTFRDWGAARETVASLLECRPRPCEIVLVNDNVDPWVPGWASKAGVVVVNYPGNRGPAFARNAGVAATRGRGITWIYFTDSGCVREPTFFAELVEASRSCSRLCVAMAGPVIGLVDPSGLSPINRYMTEEAILNPPMDASGPQAIITANAAVSVAAFRAVGGFRTDYPFAAGEDLDLGVRLRRLGPIGWVPRAVVQHRFEESLADFTRRFHRYGAGNAHLERAFALPSLRLDGIVARDPALQPLADLQVSAMRQGYDRWKEELCTKRRGRVKCGLV